MRIARLTVKNFRNLREVDVVLSPGTVIVGENRAGKSNLLFAIRLVLDPTLTPRERTLDRSDFSDSLNGQGDGWDPMREGLSIEVSVELTDFEDEPAMLAALGDSLIEGEPMRARLKYVFAPSDEDGEANAPQYRWKILGGDEENEVRWDVRRFLAHVYLPALRDADAQLARWRSSPLRPLLEAVAEAIDPADLADVSEAVERANREIGMLTEVHELGARIGARTKSLVGERQALETSLDVAPTDPNRLIRSLLLLVDGDAQRPLTAASLGALNVLYLALLELGLDAQLEKEEIAHVVLTIEEPEAHLHLHVQRALFSSLLRGEHAVGRTVLVTTHSPHIVSVAEPRDLVVLHEHEGVTAAHAAADADLEPEEWRDIQRYLDATRSEMVFGARVLLVEGFAELVLMPRFAEAQGVHLDRLGVTVCGVHGTHFGPYGRFLSALDIPWVVVTDGDPDRPQTGSDRASALLTRLEREGEDLEDVGVFVGATTLERDTYDVSAENRALCLEALTMERIPEADRIEIIQELERDEPAMDSELFLSIVKKAGKGSFAQRLAAQTNPPRPPAHIEHALARVSE